VGPFSLRSRRFLRAQLDPMGGAVADAAAAVAATGLQPLPSGQLAEKHGICFASPSLTRRFCDPSGAGFGFRGARHLPQVLGAEPLAEWLAALPTDVYTGPEAVGLVRGLLVRGRLQLAWRVLKRCEAVAPSAQRARLMRTAASVVGALGGA
jgi:hypothetical protein